MIPVSKVEVGIPLPDEILKPGDNPLLDLHLKCKSWDWHRLPEQFHVRTTCCFYYSWAVPTPEALEVIKSYGPIVEMGAGTGYWAALLRFAGVDVLAYDKAPGDNEQAAMLWTEVLEGSPSVLREVDPCRNLLLCWPPYHGSMGSESVRAFRGERILYIGEREGGCTGDEEMHRILAEEYRLEQVVALPNWEHCHDSLMVWGRK